MGRKKRTVYSNEFKKKVVFEALKENAPLQELATKHGVHINLIRKWKELFEENADSIFERPNKKSPDQIKLEEQGQLIESLYQQVGKLTVEKEFLKKKHIQLYGYAPE